MQFRPFDLSRFVEHETWLIEILVGFCLLFLIHYGLKGAISILRKLAGIRFSDWKVNVDKILHLPLRIFLIAIVLSYFLDIVGRRFDFVEYLGYLTPLRKSIFIACLAWIALRWKNEVQKNVFFKNLYQKGKMDPSIVPIFSKLFSASVFVVSVLLIMQIHGLNIFPLLAFGGIGAAAIAFAARDVMSNCFGGLLLFIQRPFKIGDTITILEKNIEGVVEEIGWYFTSVRDREKRPIYFPNSIFSTMLIVNNSRMSHRRICEKIRIRYENSGQIAEITTEIKKVLEECPLVDANLPILIALNAFGEYFLHLQLDVYTLETRYDAFFEAKQTILLLVYDTLGKFGVQVAIPIGLLEGTQL